MMDEVETIRKFVSDLTHSPFETREPFLSYSIGNSRWFIGCLDAYYATRAPYLTNVWADKEDNIWLESTMLGNNIEWADQEYDERTRSKVWSLNLTNFAKPEVKKEFGKLVPRVLKRLEGYERILSEVSSETHVSLEMKYDAKEHIVTFQIGAKIEAKNLDLKSNLATIKSAAEALRIAYDRITEYDNAVFSGRIRSW
jgi:hypothetical protein